MSKRTKKEKIYSVCQQIYKLEDMLYLWIDSVRQASFRLASSEPARSTRHFERKTNC